MQSLMRVLFLIAILTSINSHANESEHIQALEQRLTILEKLSTQNNKFQTQLIQQKINEAESKVQAAQAKVDLINEKYKVIEYGYGNVSNWLVAITIFLGVISLLAIALPLIIATKQRREFEKEINEIKAAKDIIEKNQRESEQLLKNTEKVKIEAEQYKDGTAQSYIQAKAFVNEMRVSTNSSYSVNTETSEPKSQIKSPKDSKSPLEILKTKAVQHYKDKEWDLAIEKLKALTDIDPNNANYWFDIGYANRILADNSNDAKAIERYLENAANAYQKATEINGNDHITFNNWGNALAGQALTKVPEEANKLFQQANDKYQKATTIKTDYHDAFFNWGNSLTAQATIKTFDEANILYQQASEKYQQATTINTDDYEAFNNWGIALLNQAQMKTGQEKNTLLENAKTVLLKGEALEKGSCSYDLACYASLINDFKACEQWLNLSKETNHLPVKKHLLSDIGLDNVRAKDWFENFINTLE